MANGFKYVSYTTDAGTIGQIRMSAQAQGIAGQGTLTATPDDDHLFAYASNPGSKRKKQLNARGVKLKREAGTAPNVKVYYTFVPITTVAALAALTVGTAVANYGGQTWTIASKVAEA